MYDPRANLNLLSFIMLLAATSLLPCFAQATRETSHEKQTRYEGYVATYQKLANERLWLFRSTVNPALLSIHIADGLDDLRRVSEYLGQSLDIDVHNIRSRATSDLDALESALEDFKTLYNLLFSLQEQDFPGLILQQRDINKTAERLLAAKECLNTLEHELPLLRSKLK